MGHERVSIKVEKLSEEYNTYHSTSTAINNQYAAVILYANSGKAGEWIQYKMPTLQEGEATLPELTRTGYKFLGWYTERTGGRKIDPYEFVTGDTTYYAHGRLSHIRLRPYFLVEQHLECQKHIR